MYKGSIFEDLKNGQVISPCIWDCFSLKAVEKTGFKCALVSGAAVAANAIGLPDIGLMTFDELLWVTERIVKAADIPILVDADEGYGDSPINVYHNISRLVDAGVKGFTLDDGMGVRGYTRLEESFKTGKKPYDVQDTDKWLAKVKAALDAIDGTDCVCIARTECLPVLGFDAAVERCQRAVDIGAPMTLINRISTLEECRIVGEKVGGWKMYPDITVDQNGKSVVSCEDIYPYGFNYVTMHYLEKGAMWGMIDYGKHNFAAKNTEYSYNHDMGGYTREEIRGFLGTNEKEWLEMERDLYASVLKK